MTTLILFVGLTGFGLFATLCTLAPVWDEDRQAPAETADATVERA